MTLEDLAKEALRFEGDKSLLELSAKFQEIVKSGHDLKLSETHPIYRFCVLRMKAVCCSEMAHLDIYVSRRALLHLSGIEIDEG